MCSYNAADGTAVSPNYLKASYMHKPDRRLCLEVDKYMGLASK